MKASGANFHFLWSTIQDTRPIQRIFLEKKMYHQKFVYVAKVQPTRIMYIYVNVSRKSYFCESLLHSTETQMEELNR